MNYKHPATPNTQTLNRADLMALLVAVEQAVNQLVTLQAQFNAIHHLDDPFTSDASQLAYLGRVSADMFATRLTEHLDKFNARNALHVTPNDMMEG